MRTDPYIVGETVKLRSYGRGERVFVKAPSGIELHIPAPSGTYSISLNEPGEWVVQWESGEDETLSVVKAPPVEPEPEEESQIPKPSFPLSSTSA